MHILAALGVALGLAQADSLTIRFVGNAGFELTDGATSLLVDLPYESGAYGYMTYEPSSLSPPGRVVSVITHRHEDHFDPASFGSTPWEIVGPAEVTSGLSESRVIDGRIVTLGDFRVQRFRTPHGDTEHYSYLIEWQGQRMYFVGDTDSLGHVMSTEGIDILFLTPWLACMAVEQDRAFPADRVILHHHTGDDRTPICGQPEIPDQGQVFTIRPG